VPTLYVNVLKLETAITLSAVPDDKHPSLEAHGKDSSPAFRFVSPGRYLLLP
jgi:hypothetical protein